MEVFSKMNYRSVCALMTNGMEQCGQVMSYSLRMSSGTKESDRHSSVIRNPNTDSLEVQAQVG